MKSVRLTPRLHTLWKHQNIIVRWGQHRLWKNFHPCPFINIHNSQLMKCWKVYTPHQHKNEIIETISKLHKHFNENWLYPFIKEISIDELLHVYNFYITVAYVSKTRFHTNIFQRKWACILWTHCVKEMFSVSFEAFSV